ncbi:translation elongation factor 4 [Kiritimatiella glycovorans]|uniref:Elongation factor 4 n=1 Tax=Kiritimatiella glycovorans TaxID=1307763 RepID=A0A0G3ED91_9BACT|nr:translation elongation factor 4 [Kiritimatiella glycovorans]AKJ64293.1 Elongation factor 4 [Kiritimatiella glycovorans]
MSDLSHIRNFSIIAHIDHGKSTLADRMLELTHTVDERKMREQVLDAMDLERERGITIKTHPVTMKYKAQDGHTYRFNLMDTPGHVDFSYEVSRSLAACEGVILVVDAAQGVEAQTVSNAFLAAGENLVIIPVLNKIDLPSALTEESAAQLEDLLAIEAEECIRVSAKTGGGVGEVMERIVRDIPPPEGSAEEQAPFSALVFDSKYDPYQGAVVYVRIFNGRVRRGDRIRAMSTGRDYEVKGVGLFSPDPRPTDALSAGDVGYLTANIKDASEISIGDTVTRTNRPVEKPLPGFQEIHPMVFAGVYPMDTADYEKLGASLEKLRLNDSAFSYQNESSAALGLGYRCGFLGLLHMEVTIERLRREFDLDIITTYPGVVYRVHLTDGRTLEIDNPVLWPETTQIASVDEPMIKVYIICLNDHIGDMMQLVMERRGTVTHTDTIDAKRLMLTCRLPLNEVLIDFYDKLKSVSRGYSSMDYEYLGYEEADLVKMDILVHGEPVDAFATIVHREKAPAQGRRICQALKDVIPRQAFSVPLQAAINGNIVARETIRQYRKDVTAKCYGGDITRKRKLLEKQKAGKKKMKQIGQVSIPQEAFIRVLKTEPS